MQHNGHIAPLWSLAALLIAESQDEEEELIALLVLALAFSQPETNRHGPCCPYIQEKVEGFFDFLLDKFVERMFKGFCRYMAIWECFHLKIFKTVNRMSHNAFWHVHGLIQDDPIFQSTGRRPQRPVKYQLVAFLHNFGENSSLQTAGVLAIAEGTVYLYAKQVCHALCNIRMQHVFWPGPAWRQFLKQAMADFGFPGCIGIVDGTLIWLMDKPAKEGWAFSCWQGFYAVSCSHSE